MRAAMRAAMRAVMRAAMGTVMRTLHIDASVGSAGDMLLAALLDAGADPGAVRAAITAVLPGAGIEIDEVRRAGLRAARARVVAPDTSPYRTWRDLRAGLAEAARRGGGLPSSVAEGATQVFARLADAEAAVHGVAPDDVHFHEVGAWDSVCDVVGCVAAITDLAPDALTCSPIATGSGSVRGDHGLMPVPVPAVAQLLLGGALSAIPGPADFEACTPTAAALLVGCAPAPAPTGRIVAVGVGAGNADPAGFANVVRVFVTEQADEPVPGRTGGAVLLETNVDDIDPRLWPGVQAELLAAGASDAWLTAIHMKKGRPATTLSVLCTADRHRSLAGLIMRLTPAIGMRVTPVGKLAADRSQATVTVDSHDIAVKIATWEGEVVNVQPEWEDVAAAAQSLGLPPKVVLARAHAEAARWWPTTA